MSNKNNSISPLSVQKSDEETKNESIDCGGFTINNSDVIKIVLELTGINIFIYDVKSDTFQIHNESSSFRKQILFYKNITSKNPTVSGFLEKFCTHKYIARHHLTNFQAYVRSIMTNKYESPIYTVPLLAENESIIWVKIHSIPQLDNNGKVVRIIGSYTDITEIKNQELEHQQSSIIFKMLKDQSLISIDINLSNDKISFGSIKNDFYTKDELSISSYSQLRHFVAKNYVKTEMVEDFLRFTDSNHLVKLFNENRIIDSYDYLRKKNDVYHWYRIMTYIYSINANDIRCFLFVSDINKQKEDEVKLDYMAKTDSLTDVFNRYHGIRQIKDYLNENPTVSSSLIFIDIDDFKKVNDYFGHPYGDTVLKTIADKIKSCFSENDIVCRIGGDEFVVLQKKVTEQACRENLSRLVSNVSTIFSTHDNTVFVTISAGYVMFPIDGSTFEELYKKADMAMFNVKSNGKNGFEVCNRINKSDK